MSSAGARVPGYRFKENKLYIFRTSQVAVIEGSPTPSAVRKRNGGEWERFDPSLKLVHRYRPRRARRRKDEPEQLTLFEEAPEARRIGEKRRAFDAFRFSLPRDLARRVEPFPGHQFSVIARSQQFRWFDDLLTSNRPLAFCVANSELLDRAFDPQLGQSKQREIMDWLGFPNSKSAVQTMKRMAPESLHARHVLALRGILRSEEKLPLLRHAHRVNAGVLELLREDEVLHAVTPKFIDEVARRPAEKYCARAASIVRDALFMHAELTTRKRAPSFGSLERAEAVHDELTRKYMKIKKGRILEYVFPKPPKPGNDAIVPIRTPRDLVYEGEEQQNCVATYSQYIAERELYVYRVLRPQRATLSLRRAENGEWQVSELYASCNRPVKSETRDVVEDWLDAL